VMLFMYLYRNREQFRNFSASDFWRAVQNFTSLDFLFDTWRAILRSANRFTSSENWKCLKNKYRKKAVVLPVENNVIHPWLTSDQYEQKYQLWLNLESDKHWFERTLREDMHRKDKKLMRFKVRFSKASCLFTCAFIGPCCANLALAYTGLAESTLPPSIAEAIFTSQWLCVIVSITKIFFFYWIQVIYEPWIFRCPRYPSQVIPGSLGCKFYQQAKKIMHFEKSLSDFDDDTCFNNQACAVLASWVPLFGLWFCGIFALQYYTAFYVYGCYLISATVYMVYPQICFILAFLVWNVKRKA